MKLIEMDERLRDLERQALDNPEAARHLKVHQRRSGMLFCPTCEGRLQFHKSTGDADHVFCDDCGQRFAKVAGDLWVPPMYKKLPHGNTCTCAACTHASGQCVPSVCKVPGCDS